jgi:hypothetical protein
MRPQPFRTYWQSTDVQRTWRRYGWTPPSKDPETVARWEYFRNLDTEHNQPEGPAPWTNTPNE